ncbi:MAG: hypothetical protein HZB26_09035 [Candidatus Hydrogenedentes bacterium]|nr:hypothetical protein [Candidatus Hydrogenedentota bacterium]
MSPENTERNTQSLRGFSKEHVWKVYELCGRDTLRTARLLDLTSDEVSEWIGASGPLPSEPGSGRLK